MQSAYFIVTHGNLGKFFNDSESECLFGLQTAKLQRCCYAATASY